MKDYYALQGSNLVFSDMGKPVKISKTKYMALKFNGYETFSVPAGTNYIGVVIQAVINRGAAIGSWTMEKALKDYCGVEIIIKKIEGETK